MSESDDWERKPMIMQKRGIVVERRDLKRAETFADLERMFGSAVVQFLNDAGGKATGPLTITITLETPT